MTQAENDKRALLLDYAKKFGCTNFVETGTYKGDTVKAMLQADQFTQIHTVDIYEDRVANAQRRFKGFPNVTCWHGDSAEIMPQIVMCLDEPTLFWLDAHHSGGQIARSKGLISTPIMSELESVLGYDRIGESVILIDDARYFTDFGGKYENYPILDEVRDKVRGWNFAVENDIIRIHA
jgi:hypothetical protein